MDPTVDDVRPASSAPGTSASERPGRFGPAPVCGRLGRPGARWLVRFVSCAYALVMAWTLVYTGEHYNVDVVAGWLGAAAAAAVARRLTRRRDWRDRAPTEAALTNRPSRWT